MSSIDQHGLGDPESIRDNRDALLHAGTYLSVVKPLRTLGISALIFGALGLTEITDGFSDLWDYVLPVVGMVLVIGGIIMLTHPSRMAMAVGGVVLITIGMWNIIDGILTLNGRGEASFWTFLFMALGLLQLLWGANSLQRYRKLAGVGLSPPPSDVQTRMDGILKALSSSAGKVDPRVIEINVSEMSMGNEVSRKWRAMLLEDGAVFLRLPMEEVLVEPIEAITLEGQLVEGKKIPIKVCAGPRMLAGTISSQDISRLQEWRADATVAADVPPPLPGQ